MFYFCEMQSNVQCESRRRGKCVRSCVWVCAQFCFVPSSRSIQFFNLVSRDLHQRPKQCTLGYMCAPEHMFVITINVLLSVEHNGLSSRRYFMHSETMAVLVHEEAPNKIWIESWSTRNKKKIAHRVTHKHTCIHFSDSWIDVFTERCISLTFSCSLTISPNTWLIKFGLNELILLRAITSLKS